MSERTTTATTATTANPSIETLAERHYPELRRVAYGMVRSVDIADDLVQEAFLAAVRNFDRYDPTCSFISWMRGIIRHRFLRYLSGRHRRESPCEHAELESLLAREIDEGFMQGEQDYANRVLLDCLQELPGAMRQLIELHYFDRMSTRSIAHRLQTSEGAVRVRLHRGRARLREAIGRRLPEPGLRQAA